MNRKMQLLSEKLRDDRSKRLVFVSHCILNENARYLGGAFRKGAVDEVVRALLTQGVSIVQMPCPEQKAWGSVLKPYLWLLVGAKGSLVYRLRKVLFPLFIWYTRVIYRRIAKKTVVEISEYQKAGFKVVGVVGIDGSPTCGVLKSLDLSRYELLTAIDINTLNRENFNSLLYSAFLVEGSGMYIALIKQELKKRGIQINFFSHDLINEMQNIIPPTPKYS